MPILGPIPGGGGGAGNNTDWPIPDEVLEPTDSQAQYAEITENNGVPNVWTDYQVTNRYEYAPNIFMNGVTSPSLFQGASVSFVQLASPTLLLIADWTACRMNAIPTAPPTTCPEDWIFMWASPEPFVISVMGDGGTPIYRLSGTYVFGHKNPGSTAFAHVSFPASPMFRDVFTRRITESDFGTDILFANTVNILRGAIPIK